MKVARGEFTTMLTVFGLAALLLAAFPIEAFRFRARAATPAHSGGVSFVTLTEEEETLARKAALTAWQSAARGLRGVRAELLAPDLPEAEADPVLAFRPRPTEAAVFEPSYPAAAASVSAADPAPIPVQPAARAQPTFSREEMLRLDTEEE